MNLKSRALSSLVILLLGASRPATQADQPSLWQTEPNPVPTNLDIPPQEEPSPEELELFQQAREAIWDPESFHERILQNEPGRRVLEALATMAILNPDEFSRAHPKSPEEVRAEAIAAHAVLNPKLPNQPSGRPE